MRKVSITLTLLTQCCVPSVSRHCKKSMHCRIEADMAWQWQPSHAAGCLNKAARLHRGPSRHLMTGSAMAVKMIMVVALTSIEMPQARARSASCGFHEGYEDAMHSAAICRGPAEAKAGSPSGGLHRGCEDDGRLSSQLPQKRNGMQRLLSPSAYQLKLLQALGDGVPAHTSLLERDGELRALMASTLTAHVS